MQAFLRELVRPRSPDQRAKAKILFPVLIFFIAMFAAGFFVLVRLGPMVSTLPASKTPEPSDAFWIIVQFLVTGFLLVAASTFISKWVATVLSAILAALGVVLGATDSSASSPREHLIGIAVFSAPALLTLLFSWLFVRMEHDWFGTWGDAALPAPLLAAVVIGAAYGWFYMSVTINPIYTLCAILSLMILRRPHWAVWIAAFIVFVAAIGVLVAIQQGPEVRFAHRVPWLAATLLMLVLAWTGRQELHTGREGPPRTPSDHALSLPG